jgi:AhpD family alkylhydroperoxidase
MSTRFKMGRVRPAAYQALDHLDQFVNQSSLDKSHRELIRLRASQINGCAYCVNYHTGDALMVGIPPEKLTLVPVWKEAPNVFDPEERLLLAITEAVTLIQQGGLSDELYEKAMAHWGEEKTADILMTIITINAWNRIGVGLKMEPEFSHA